MSYNDHRALEMLPARITSLQARIDVLTSALADPDLYARDAAQFNNTTSALAAARDELIAAEEQWLSLEMLREESTAPKAPASVRFQKLAQSRRAAGAA